MLKRKGALVESALVQCALVASALAQEKGSSSRECISSVFEVCTSRECISSREREH